MSASEAFSFSKLTGLGIFSSFLLRCPRILYNIIYFGFTVQWFLKKSCIKLDYIKYFLVFVFTILSLEMLDCIIKSSLILITYEHLTKNPLFLNTWYFCLHKDVVLTS